MPRSLQRIVVAGCNGRFGSTLGRKIRHRGIVLTGVDEQAQPSAPGIWDRYLRGSVSEPGEPILAAIEKADCTILCTPEPVAVEALARILPRVRDEACVADIASVKTRIASVVDRFPGAFGYLGIHPMFAPTDDFRSRNIVLVRIKENGATRKLERIVEEWNASLTYMSADEHDRLAARVQAVPHAVLLAAGAALSRSGATFDEVSAAATPVQAALLALLARIVRGGAETYWSIQVDNPHAAEARREVIEALRELDRLCDERRRGEFEAVFEKLSRFLGEDSDALFRRSQRLVEALISVESGGDA